MRVTEKLSETSNIGVKVCTGERKCERWREVASRYHQGAIRELQLSMNYSHQRERWSEDSLTYLSGPHVLRRCYPNTPTRIESLAPVRDAVFALAISLVSSLYRGTIRYTQPQLKHLYH